MRYFAILVVLGWTVLSGIARAAPATQSAGTGPVLPASADRATLYLARPDPQPNAWVTTLILRELQRQALSMAARDGMGLYTRDEVLREFDPAGGPAAVRVNFDWNPSVGLFRSHTTIVNGPAGGTPGASADATIPMWFTDGFMNLPFCVARAEEATHDRMPALLAGLGFRGTVPADNDGPAPAGVDDLLYQTTLFAPLAAVQQTHAAVRRDGASPARLEALARGYANLGQLTRFQWSTDRQVFLARSLLYGQRLVVRWPDRPDAYWARAYAEAMAGLHAAALDDVAKARHLAAGGSVPAWAEVIEPLCHYDLATLTAAVSLDPRRAPLNALCAFLTVEHCGSTAMVEEVGSASLRSNPACYAVLDGMTNDAGVGPGARLTEVAPEIVARSLPADAALLPDLPPAARKAMADLSAAVAPAPGNAAAGGDPVELLAAAAQSLVDASDVRVEPSLVVAGRLVQETDFVHAVRRAYFIENRWGIDSSDFVHDARPLYRGHPLAPYIESIPLPRENRPAFLAKLVVDDPQDQMGDLIKTVRNNDPVPGQVGGSKLPDRAWQDADVEAYGRAAELGPLSRQPRNFGLNLTVALRDASPFCPIVEATRLRDHWGDPDVAAEVNGWQQKYAQQPATLAALASGFTADKRYDDAVEVLQQYMRIAGDYDEAAALADLYLRQHDEAGWLATLEASLKRTDYGLDHARANVVIARHFMDKGDFKRALPYADEAETSGAFWAMKCDADCHRATGDTEGADRIMAEAKAHYGHS